MAALFLAVLVLLPKAIWLQPALWCCPVDVYCGILWSVVYINMGYYNKKGNIQ
jgi:hypothetical protein